MNEFWSAMRTAGLIVVGVALITFGIHQLARAARVPKQVWIDECAELYSLPSCHKRWDDAHPMPAGYGFGGKVGAP